MKDNEINKSITILKSIIEFLEIFGNKREVYNYTILSIVGSLIEALSLPLISFYLLFAINPTSTEKYTKIFEKYADYDLTLMNFSLFIIIFIFVKNTYLYKIDKYIAKVNITIYNSVTMKLINSFLNANFYYINNISSSAYMNIILNEINSTVVNIFNALISSIKEIFVSLFIIGFLIYVDLSATIVILLYFTLLFVLLKFTIFNKLEYFGSERLRYSELRMENLFNIVDNIKIIKLYNKQTFFSQQFHKMQENFSLFAIYPTFYKKIPKYVVETLIFTILPLAFILSETTSSVSQEYIILVLIAATRMLPSFSRIISSLNEMQNFKKSLEEVIDMQKKLNNHLNKLDFIQDSHNVKNDGTLVIDSVDFKVSDSFGISNINLDIQFGNVVAFVGPSGGGKTTLINLIMNFYTPKKGKITYAGVGLQHLINYNKISYVSQNITILSDTIAKNIAFGCKEDDIDREKINQVLKIACLDDFVSTLPNKLNHILKNENISGGQKQRLALARALYNEPKILILDEFTSSLDAYTENSIMNLIYEIKENMTIIVIAHRLNTVKYADKICYVENGDIREEGTFDELMIQKGKFYTLVNL